MNPKLRARLKRSPLRNARERSGLTREQLAVRAGLSSTTLYLAECGSLLSRTSAAKLAEVLGVPTDELLP